MNATVQKYLDAGINVIPIKPDKKPAIPSWIQYQSQVVHNNGMFETAQGLAAICGRISGNLEALDFDTKYDKSGTLWEDFKQLFIDTFENSKEFWDSLLVQKSPSGGYHIFYRCDTIEGNQKLARNEGGQVIIETRGEGGYIAVEPTPNYKFLQGRIGAIAHITPEQREQLFNLCKSFNEHFPEREQKAPAYAVSDSDLESPFDAFNERGDILELLLDEGWKQAYQKGQTIYLTRPGKGVRDGISATLHHKFYNRFYCFTSNAYPFDVDKSYTATQVFALLKHAGDYKAARRELLNAGFGKEKEKKHQNTKATREIAGKAAAAEGKIQVQKSPDFPLQVFPEKYRQIVETFSSAKDFPKNHLAFGILNVVASQIGLTHKIRLANGWVQTSLLYSALVGDSAIGKSPTLDFCFEPVEKAQALFEQQYRKDLEHFGELKKMQARSKSNEAVGESPVCRKILISDATLESTIAKHKQNIKGLALVSDELSGWLKSFGQYKGKKSQSSDSKTWLGIWNNKSISLIRLSREDIYLPASFVSVVGGIQPDVLPVLAEEGFNTDGFLYRFLFCFAQVEEKKTWDSLKQKVDDDIRKDYHKLIDTFIDMQLPENNPEPCYLYLSDEADKVWGEWYDNNNRSILKNQQEGNSAMCSILSKLSIYCTRFALILEMMDYSVGDSGKDCISGDSMRRACELAEYFKQTAILALQTIDSVNEQQSDSQKTKVQSRVNWVQIFGQNEAYTTGELVAKLVAEYGCSVRSAKYWIQSELSKVSHGVWRI